MAFQKMNYYKEGELPTYGDCDNYQFCKNVSQFRPLDVSAIKSSILNDFESLIDSCDSSNQALSNDLAQLETEWGTNFISIDNRDANIIDVSKFSPSINKIMEEINNQKRRFENFINYIMNITDGINQYLDKLENNSNTYSSLISQYNDLANEYNSLVKQYNSLVNSTSPDTSRLSSIKSEMNYKDNHMTSLRNIINMYVELPSPDGTWCLQNGV